MRPLIVITTLILLLALPLGSAQVDIPDDAVVNGGFEIAAHPARPTICTVLGDGYINLFEPGNPFGLPWLVALNPCHTGAVKAAQWSSGLTTDVGDFDGDGDRELKFLAGSDDPNTGAAHNLWQAYPNPHQAYTGNFETYELTVDGEIPPGAIVRLSFATSPLTNPSPRLVLYIDCNLVFNAALLDPDGDGQVSVDPTDGTFSSASADCTDTAAAWNAAEAGSDERREILDGLRLVQNSFWRWNSGSEDVVIDDVSMVGSRTVAEALLS